MLRRQIFCDTKTSIKATVILFVIVYTSVHDVRAVTSPCSNAYINNTVGHYTVLCPRSVGHIPEFCGRHVNAPPFPGLEVTIGIEEMVWNFRVMVRTCSRYIHDNMDKNRNWQGHQLAALTNQYFARAEWRELQMQRSAYMEIYYDKTGERSAVKVTGFYDAGETVVLITDYRNLKVYNIQDGTCTYQNVSAAGGLFGIDYSKLKNGTGDLLNAFYSLDLIGNAAYQGESIVRNTHVDIWQTCRYNNNTKSTTTTDVYFLKSDWESASGSHGVPLRRVTNTVTSGVSETIEIDYVYFQEGLPTDQSVFQLPVTLQCTGRRKDVTAPSPPPHFSFDLETVLPLINQSTYYKIWYDEDSNLTRTDSLFVPHSSNNGKYRRTTIHDFTDVKPLYNNHALDDETLAVVRRWLLWREAQYDINNSDGSCTVSTLEYDPKLFPDISPTDTINTPRQMFELKGNFSYTGQTSLRGVPADVYMATLPPPPGVSGGDGAFTWYFSSASWHMVTSVDQTDKFQVPLKVDVNYPKRPLHIVNNIYNFVTDRPDPETFRMDACLENADLRTVDFLLQGDATLLRKKQNLLVDAIRKTMYSSLKISPLRIQQLFVVFTPTLTNVNLILMGMWNKAGSVDDLARRLVAIIDHNQFQVVVPWDSEFGTQNLTFHAVPYTVIVVKKQGHVVHSTAPSTPVTTATTENVTHGCTCTVLQQKSSSSSGVSTDNSTAPSTPVTTATTENVTHGCTVLQQQSSSSSGVSTGGAAGIAIGTAVVGIVLGIAIAYLFISRRYRRDNDDMKHALTMDHVNS